jgi:hypothetical protein
VLGAPPEHLTGMAGYWWWGPLCAQPNPASVIVGGPVANAWRDDDVAADESWSCGVLLTVSVARVSKVAPTQQLTRVAGFVTKWWAARQWRKVHNPAAHAGFFVNQRQRQRGGELQCPRSAGLADQPVSGASGVRNCRCCYVLALDQPASGQRAVAVWSEAHPQQHTCCREINQLVGSALVCRWMHTHSTRWLCDQPVSGSAPGAV